MVDRSARRARAEALLRGALELYSPSGEEEAVADYLVSAMRERGMDARVDAVGNAVGTIGRGAVHLVMLGHIDTVPGVVEVRTDAEGRLFGRGAVDAKGPFCSFIEAATDLDAEVLDRVTVTLVGAVEEEVSSSRGAHHAFPTLAPDLVIIGEPSGWDGVTLGYKGRQGLVFTCAQDMAHRAGEQVSAADQAFRFWRRLQAWRDGFNGKRSIFDRLDASITRLETGDDPLVDRAELAGDLRLPVGFPLDQLRKLLTDAALACDGAVAFNAHVAAVRSPKNTPLVRAFLKAIRGEGGKPRFKVKTGTSDMNLSVRYHPDIPVVAYGPGDSSLDHTPGEHVEIEEYHQGIAVLRGVLGNLAGS